jgi:type II secretory pathway component PulK
MWVTIGLAAMVLVLAEAMRVEMVSSANEYSALQAQAIEEGAQRYVLSQVGSLSGGQVPVDANVPCEGIRVGQGAFWIIRPDPDSTQTQTMTFGLVDEASKVNLNSAPLSVLEMLPDMTTELAACIADWRDQTVHPGGAKSDYYMMLNPPYQCKQAPFETVEELLLVKDMTTDILFGQDTNRNGIRDAGEATGFGQFDRGLYPFVTVYSNQLMPGATGPARHAINVCTAPADVLAALPGITSSDVSAILAAQQQQQSAVSNASSIAAVPWVARTLAAQRSRAGALLSPLITLSTYQFSADIVSVSGDGRAFKRCRIVVDNRQSPARIIYRQDTTSLGWPLSPDIISGLRAGKPIDQAYQPVSNMRGLTTH